MLSLKELEEDILVLLHETKANKLQRKKIRTKSYQEKFQKRYEPASYNIILQRSLNRLRDLGFLEKDNAGHQEVYYFLTKKGLKMAKTLALERNVLSKAKNLGEEKMEYWLQVGSLLSSSLEKLGGYLKPFFVFLSAQAQMKEYPRCLTFSLDKNVNPITKRVELSLAIMLADLLEDREGLEEVIDKDFNLHFRFNGNEIEKYLQAIEKIEKETQEEPLLKLPDIKDYLKKQKEEK